VPGTLALVGTVPAFATTTPTHRAVRRAPPHRIATHAGRGGHRFDNVIIEYQVAAGAVNANATVVLNKARTQFGTRVDPRSSEIRRPRPANPVFPL
jgi:hypothetical protein